eukprot:jgi/Astpho2/6646/fgenesh1_pm.00101_%23_17_t
MVGAALAAALSSHPKTAHLKVAVLDRQVWDSSGAGYVRYRAADAGRTVMGHVAENSVLQAALMHCLHRPGANVELMWPVSVEGLQLPAYPSASDAGGTQSSSPFAELHLAGGRSLKARLVVGADGARSHTRQLAQMRTMGYSYGQRGLVVSVRTASPNRTAWQRFLPTGPLALLPVRDGYSNVVWSTTPQHARQLEHSTPQELVRALNEPFGQTSAVANLFGAPDSTEPFQLPPMVTEAPGPPPKSFQLVLCQAGKYVRPRLALVGDAAHAVHPLAGQGVNLGFADVAQLTDAIALAVETGTDIGDLQHLETQYERPRQSANMRMAATLDALKRVFQPQNAVFASIRGAGLNLINSAPAVRTKIMEVAMG